MNISRPLLGWTCALLLSNSFLTPCFGGNLSVYFGTLGAQTPSLATSERTLSAVASNGATQLSAEELNQLGGRDVVLIIDKSRSMTKTDCMSSLSNTRISRWQWCREQAQDIAAQTSKVLPTGIKVVLYSDNIDVNDNVHAAAVAPIFEKVQCDGGTDTAAALRGQLAAYFSKRQNDKQAKPLLIAIVTDGCPDSPIHLREAIVEATKQMVDAKEVAITFLQIGNDTNGSRFLGELNHRLVAEHARYDIVDVKPFAQVTSTGLARALAQTVTRVQSM